MKQTFTLLIAAILVLLCGSIATAQTLRGTVADAISGETLVGATVRIVETNEGTVTDIDGNYSITIATPGRYTVETKFVGYEPSVMKEVLVAGNKEVVIDVQLREVSQEIGEIVVKPRINKSATVNSTALVGGVMLSMEEATRFAGGYNDPARLVSAFAGISASNNGNGVSVHGNAPQLMTYRVEGVEVFTPNHYNDFYEAGFGMVSALNANVIGNSDFFVSTFNANYNNSLSGVFDIKMRSGNNLKHENIVQVGTVSEELTCEGPISKKNNSSYIFNYRYGFTSLADKMGLIEAGETTFDFQDFSLKLNFPSKNAGTFSIFGLGYYDGAEDDASDDVKTTYDASRQKGTMFGLLGGLVHKIRFGNKWTWRTTFAYNGQHIKSDVGYWELKRDADGVIISNPKPTLVSPHRLIDYSTQKMNEDRLLVNTELSKQVNDKWLMQFGAEYSYRSFDLRYSSADFIYDTAPFTDWVKTDGNTYLTSVFWQNVITATPNFSVNLGVNTSYFGYSKDFSGVEPRISMKWEAGDRSSISLGYGIHSMIERLDAYFMELDGVQLNKKLGFSKAHHVLATYNYKWTDNINMRFNTYYQYGFDTPVGSTPGSTFCAVNRFMNYFDEPLVNKGNTRNYGADITLEHYMYHGYYGQVNVSVFKSEYKALDNKWRSQLYDRGYTAKILGGKEWMVGRNKQNVLNVSLKFTSQGGLHYTPIDVKAMNACLDAGEMPEHEIFDEKNAMSKQYKPENTVDFTVSIKINKKRVSHTFAFEGLNILQTETACGERFDIERRVVTTDKVGISLPNFFYRLDF